MAERGLALGGAIDSDPYARGGRRSRPSLVPLHPPADEPHASTEALITMLVNWVNRAREQQCARREAGLPAIDVSAENAVVDRFAASLGPDGAEIALALISRSRPGFPE